jgi:hypothetical protein
MFSSYEKLWKDLLEELYGSETENSLACDEYGQFWKSKYIEARNFYLRSNWSPNKSKHVLVPPNTEFKIVTSVTINFDCN